MMRQLMVFKIKLIPTQKTSLLFYKSVVLFVLISCTNKFLIDYRNVDAKEVWKSYQSHYQGLRSFQADATITLNIEENGKVKSNDIKAEIFWTENDSLLIDLTYSILNIDVSKIFVADRNYIFTSRTEDEDVFIRGFVDDGYLNQVFNIDFPLKKWGRSLFLSQVELDSNWTEARILSDGRLECRYQNHSVKYRKDYFLPSEIHYYDHSGAEEISLTMTGEIKVGKFIFPQRIVYFNRRQNAEIIIHYKSIKTNKSLDKDFFEVKIPSNLKQVNYE